MTRFSGLKRQDYANSTVYKFDFCLATRAGWRVLHDTVCTEYDTHRLDTMETATSIDACIKQCYGFLLNHHLYEKSLILNR